VSEFQIDYTIRRDGEEIGFGGATWGDIDGALYAIDSDIGNRNWETSSGMPDPSEVDQ
jgi:outer membrane protein assembly factor BamB